MSISANPRSEAILAHLHKVALERHRRVADSELGERVQRLKTYQHERFASTHADLLANPRYREASTFFLMHLYGPEDFSGRDDQFARVVPAMIRLFPGEVIDTVTGLAELHAISEHLDTKMATHLDAGKPLDRHAYLKAWQQTAEPDSRQRQIDLSLQIGHRLDRLTRNPLIRHSLRMMRGPAKAAGLGELQKFLEAGFEAFRAMRGSKEFLSLIEARETHLASALDVLDPQGDREELKQLLP